MTTANEKPFICQPTNDYTTVYPAATQFAERQRSIFWPPEEIAVEKDLSDMHNEVTEAEYHGIITTLKLFTMYELMAGGEYWGDRIMKEFPRPDIQMMASCFSFFELNIHAVFYDKINRLLGFSNTEFYKSYLEDETLSSRMDFIEEYVNHEDLLLSIAVFSMVEGAVLYSSFAYLKHFQNLGKNKIVNINAGISFSVRDEALHAEGAAWLFKQLKSELKPNKRRMESFEKKVLKAAQKIVEHEDRIVEMIFEKGKIKGITELQMKNFVRHRVDLCLSKIDIDPIYKVEYNPISKWFYRSINGGAHHDFFVAVGSEYNRNYKVSDLGFPEDLMDLAEASEEVKEMVAA